MRHFIEALEVGVHSDVPTMLLYGVMIVWSLDLQLPMQSVHITTKVLISNRAQSEVHSIQQYVIKFVSDLGQVDGLLRVLRLLPLIKLAATI